ncbi:hypothetical protein OJ997_27735 [Solirubrobacter phytolaccae]|uniref:Uncharacterized protein n=1 Tax=Solirubrobacter phytolaccae TaxID=1404360 RepID=A0A9X3NFM6_9ACTN|nr:hypothetical protein [Solirubrobacter phytolaccae]MDA0184132.1 hypothetical protein [Solirubrobacter phytolaccae]
MSLTYVCDYCGEPLDDLRATVRVHGRFPDESRRDGAGTFDWVDGHYHTDDEHGCYDKVAGAVKLARGAGPSLAKIRTATDAEIEALRPVNASAPTLAPMSSTSPPRGGLVGVVKSTTLATLRYAQLTQALGSLDVGRPKLEDARDGGDELDEIQRADLRGYIETMRADLDAVDALLREGRPELFEQRHAGEAP